MAVADLHLVILDRAFIVLHCALILEDDLLLVLEGLARNGVLCPRLLVAFEVHLRLGEQILIPLEDSLRLRQLGLVRPRIDVDERIALLDVLAFSIVHSSDHARDLSGDGIRVDRRYGSNRVKVDSNAAGLRGSEW